MDRINSDDWSVWVRYSDGNVYEVPLTIVLVEWAEHAHEDDGKHPKGNNPWDIRNSTRYA